MDEATLTTWLPWIAFGGGLILLLSGMVEFFRDKVGKALVFWFFGAFMIGSHGGDAVDAVAAWVSSI